MRALVSLAKLLFSTALVLGLSLDVNALGYVLAEVESTAGNLDAIDHTTELFVTITIVVSIIVFFLRRKLVKHARRVQMLTDTTVHLTNPSNYVEPYIQKCMIIINARFKEDLKISDVIAVLHISEAHLQQMLKDHTGKFFVEHLNYVRVSHAKRLLMNTDRQISSIAKEVGYRNTHYFIRLFKHENGMSPEKFRHVAWNVDV